MSKHKQADKGDFQELVAGIRETEREADSLKADYDSKAAELLKMANEKAVEMREHYEKKAADAKNKILSAERQKTEKLAQEIISDAKKEASHMRTRKLDRKGVESAFNAFVSSL